MRADDDQWMALTAAFGPVLKQAFPDHTPIERMGAADALCEVVKARAAWFLAPEPPGQEPIPPQAQETIAEREFALTELQQLGQECDADAPDEWAMLAQTEDDAPECTLADATKRMAKTLGAEFIPFTPVDVPTPSVEPCNVVVGDKGIDAPDTPQQLYHWLDKIETDARLGNTMIGDLTLTERGE